MPELVLTEEQTRAVVGAQGCIQVKDHRGNVLGRLHPNLDPAHIAEYKRLAASPGPWFTGQQMQSMLTALQTEWERTGGFDEAHMDLFLERLEVADPGHMRSDEDK